MRARDAWPHEAHHFTPWLLRNAADLGEALGMDLELGEAEHSVGDFSLDLIGRDLATNELVIIENQLDKSDHSHLGQLLTYAGGTDAAHIVWIADEFRSEHRAALDWLNERTGQDTRFFAVEVSVVRIGDSALAPLFDVVVQPNDWQKSVRSSSTQGAPSERQGQYRRLWAQCIDELRMQAPGWTHQRAPGAANWISLPTGTSNVIYALAYGREGPRVELYFCATRADINEDNFEKILARRAELEGAFGQPLEWQRLEGKKACRIYTTSGLALPDDEESWEGIVDWYVNSAVRLRDAIDSMGGLKKLLDR
jgi:hypothetical protein